MRCVDGFVGLDEDVARREAERQDGLALGSPGEVERVTHQIDVGGFRCQ